MISLDLPIIKNNLGFIVIIFLFIGALVYFHLHPEQDPLITIVVLGLSTIINRYDNHQKNILKTKNENKDEKIAILELKSKISFNKDKCLSYKPDYTKRLDALKPISLPHMLSNDEELKIITSIVATTDSINELIPEREKITAELRRYPPAAFSFGDHPLYKEYKTLEDDLKDKIKILIKKSDKYLNK